MPFRLGPEYGQPRAKVAFTTSAEMPSMIYAACLATGCVSNTVYVQHAVARALAEDLGIPFADIVANLPTPRGPTKHVYPPGFRAHTRRSVAQDSSGGRTGVGPANTVEEVR